MVAPHTEDTAEETAAAAEAAVAGSKDTEARRGYYSYPPYQDT